MAGRKSFSRLIERRSANPEYGALLERERQAAQIALALTDLRESRKLTQQQVADLLGVTQARVSNIEHGRDLNFSTIQRYVEALGGELKILAAFPDCADVELAGHHSAYTREHAHA